MVGTMTISVIDRKLGTFITVHTELSQSSDEGVKLSHVYSSAMLGHIEIEASLNQDGTWSV